MNKILEHCVRNRIRDIQLFSAVGKMEFSWKHGFQLRPANALGMEIRKKYDRKE